MDKKYMVPPIDIFESDEEYVLILDMPGVDKEGIDIGVTDNTLTITGTVKQVAEEWKPISREFELSDYKREINIGNKVDRDKIEANYENGVLTVKMAKSEAVKPRKIDVKIA